jgi:hypothetical protein
VVVKTVILEGDGRDLPGLSANRNRGPGQTDTGLVTLPDHRNGLSKDYVLIFRYISRHRVRRCERVCQPRAIGLANPINPDQTNQIFGPMRVPGLPVFLHRVQKRSLPLVVPHQYGIGRLIQVSVLHPCAYVPNHHWGRYRASCGVNLCPYKCILESL